MLAPRTIRILAILLAAYVVLVVCAYWGPSSLAAIGSYFVMVPLLSVFVFHKVGIPGLLENNGACGWGWCAPTVFGWALLAFFWTGVVWLAAWALARLTTHSRGD